MAVLYQGSNRLQICSSLSGGAFVETFNIPFNGDGTQKTLRTLDYNSDGDEDLALASGSSITLFRPNLATTSTTSLFLTPEDVQIDGTANRLYMTESIDFVAAYAAAPNGSLSVINTRVQLDDNSNNVPVERLALSPDRRWLLGTGRAINAILTWPINAATGAIGTSGAWSISRVPTDMVVSPDKQRVTVLIPTGFLCVYGFNSSTGELDTQLGAVRSIDMPSNSQRIVSLGDINGDGFADIAVIPPAVVGPTSVPIVLGDAGGPSESALSSLSTCPGVTDIAAADFDGDSTLDLIVTCTNFVQDSSVVLFHHGIGDGTFAGGVDFVNPD